MVLDNLEDLDSLDLPEKEDSRVHPDSKEYLVHQEVLVHQDQEVPLEHLDSPEGLEFKDGLAPLDHLDKLVSLAQLASLEILEPLDVRALQEVLVHLDHQETLELLDSLVDLDQLDHLDLQEHPDQEVIAILLNNKMSLQCHCKILHSGNPRSTDFKIQQRLKNYLTLEAVDLKCICNVFYRSEGRRFLQLHVGQEQRALCCTSVDILFYFLMQDSQDQWAEVEHPGSWDHLDPMEVQEVLDHRALQVPQVDLVSLDLQERED